MAIKIEYPNSKPCISYKLCYTLVKTLMSVKAVLPAYLINDKVLR